MAADRLAARRRQLAPVGRQDEPRDVATRQRLAFVPGQRPEPRPFGVAAEDPVQRVEGDAPVDPGAPV